MDSNDIGQPVQEFISSIDESFNADSVDAPRESQQRTRRCIHKVPQYCLKEEIRHVFEPKVVSLGPYHFNKPAFSETERFKAELLNKFITRSMAADPTKDKAFFFKEILERMTEIRSNYIDSIINSFDDETWASAILNDTSFMVSYMEDFLQVTHGIQNHLGFTAVVFLYQDYFKLENQIPFWVIKHVMDLRFGQDEADEILRKHFSFFCFNDEDLLNKLPWGDAEEQQPLHFLEAYRTTLLKGEVTTKAKLGILSRFLCIFTQGKIWKPEKIVASTKKFNLSTFNYPFRSVTYLQAKGIYFRPSSESLKDITFTSNPCYGVLKLPICFVSGSTSIFFSNLVALEMSPGFPFDFDITYYVNFMKSLIETEKDVRELRERDILFTDFGADEEIVEAFKGIDTHGFSDFGIFTNVKTGIDEHCNSKAKTWISDLVHSYFRSPWTTIGLLAAILILCLTFLQTYFTINPRRRS